MTEYVDDAAGAQLRAQGLCYLDLAANAWLQHPAAEELFVLIQGRPRYKKPVETAGAAFCHDGVRVRFYALMQPPKVCGIVRFGNSGPATHPATKLPQSVQRCLSVYPYGWPRKAKTPFLS